MVETQEVRDSRVTESHAELQQKQGRGGSREEEEAGKRRRIGEAMYSRK